MHQPKLILPITELSAEALKTGLDRREWFASASALEVAAVLLIQKVPTLAKNKRNVAALVERALSDLTAATGPKEVQTLKDTVVQSWSKEAYEAGLVLLESEGIDLLRDQEGEVESGVDADGKWDFSFSSRVAAARDPFHCEVSLAEGNNLRATDPQARVLRTFISQPDESLNLQGFAGSGKTHLARALLSVLSPFQTLVLAMTSAQLKALVYRLGNPEVLARTFSHLATEIMAAEMPEKRWASSRRSGPTYQVSDRVIAAALGIHAVGNLGPEQAAQACRRAVMSFCASGDASITRAHLPKLADSLSEVDCAVLLEFATQLWEETVEPTSADFQPPLRAYHRIKFVALAGFKVPDHYTHIIVDEAHDLSPAMTQLLDRSEAAVITLGDKFQRLNGVTPARARQIRTQEVNLTVRAGRQVEQVLNPIIDAHPSKVSSPLLGSAHKRTTLTYYDKASIPEYRTTILVGTEFHLFEWFQRLSHGKAKFCLLPGAVSQFRSFVIGLLNLYHHQQRSNNSYLFRYPTWDSLAREHRSGRAFARIEALFAKGYKEPDFERSIFQMTPMADSHILLGKVEDARNLEFESVMLAPELFANVGAIKSKRLMAEILSTLYTGASRARSQLILPGYMRDWLADQAAAEIEDKDSAG